jgi:hypothetical protein
MKEGKCFHIYPVESPTFMVGMKKKCSFLIEGGVQSPALSNGVYIKLKNSQSIIYDPIFFYFI